MKEFGKRKRAKVGAPKKRSSFFGKFSFSANSDKGSNAEKEFHLDQPAHDSSRPLGADSILLAQERMMEENKALQKGLSDLKNEIISLKTAPPVATVPLAVPAGVNSEVYDLLAELRGDIVALKEEQHHDSRSEVSEVHDLLAELKGDIAALKEEQHQSSSSGNSEVHDLLAELKGDIVALKEEQAATVSQPDNEVHNMLAELKKDILTLKSEHGSEAAMQPSAEAGEVRSLLAELKGDIVALKEEQAKSAARLDHSKNDEVHQLLQELKGDIVNLKEEQARTRAQMPVAFSGTTSGRISNLLSQLKEEIDTARAEQGEISREQGENLNEENVSEIDTLSTVNNVLTLLIGNGDRQEGEEGAKPENATGANKVVVAE